MSARLRDINMGDATVPYAKAVKEWPDGWVLPGGQRTNSFERALKVAKNIDKTIKKMKGKMI